MDRKQLKAALFEKSLQHAEFVLCTDIDSFIPVNTGINLLKKKSKNDLYDSFKTIVTGNIPNQE